MESSQFSWFAPGQAPTSTPNTPTNLGDSFTEAGDLGYSLQILSVWIAVQREVGLENLKLLFAERCANSFGFGFRALRFVVCVRVCGL